MAQHNEDLDSGTEMEEKHLTDEQLAELQEKIALRASNNNTFK